MINKENLETYWTQSIDCEWNNVNTETDTEYSITADDVNKIVYLSFQGSTSKLDWLQNFSFWKKPYKNMKKVFFVHAGFLKKYKSVKDSIFRQLIPYIEQDYEVEGRGFSQGASIMQIAHEDIFYNIDPSIHSVTFAGARVFGWFNRRVLTQRFKNFQRVYNRNDIVTKVPYWWMHFTHLGERVRLGKCKLFVFPWNWVKEHMNYTKLF